MKLEVGLRYFNNLCSPNSNAHVFPGTPAIETLPTMDVNQKLQISPATLPPEIGVVLTNWFLSTILRLFGWDCH